MELTTQQIAQERVDYLATEIDRKINLIKIMQEEVKQDMKAKKEIEIALSKLNKVLEELNTPIQVQE